mgnify:FL=1
MVGNENSTEDMNRFINALDVHFRSQFGSAIVLVHHTGHEAASRARGSSVLPAAVDWSYQVTRGGEKEAMILDFEQTLIKDGKPLPNKRFQFQEVQLPEMVDDDNVPTTSGALKEIDYVAKKKSKALGKNQKVVKEAIDDLYINKVADAQRKGKDIEHIRVSKDELHEQLKVEGKIKGNLPDVRKKVCVALIENEEIGGNDEIGYKPADAPEF